MDKNKVYKDISKFIYKYTHDAALTYPIPSDYAELAMDMGFAKNSLRMEFPEGSHMGPGRPIVRDIYDSGRNCGKELSYSYNVGMGGQVEVVYYLNEGVELNEEELEIYQWVCDQIFLVYGKQQVIDALNLMTKVKGQR